MSFSVKNKLMVKNNNTQLQQQKVVVKETSCLHASETKHEMGCMFCSKARLKMV